MTSRKNKWWRLYEKRHHLSERSFMIDHNLHEPKRGNVMFWTFIIFAVLALVFIKLGAYSVWMAILSGGLKFAALVIICLVVWIVFKNVFHKSS